MRTEKWLLWILKLPKAAAQGPGEIPSVSAAVLVAGSAWRGRRWEQSRAVLGCSHRPAIPGPQARTPAACSHQPTERHWSRARTLNQLLNSQQTQGPESFALMQTVGNLLVVLEEIPGSPSPPSPWLSAEHRAEQEVRF